MDSVDRCFPLERRKRLQEDGVFPYTLLTDYRVGGEKWCQHASWVIDTFWLGVKAFQD